MTTCSTCSPPDTDNSARWKNQEYVDLVTRAKMVAGIPERSKLYAKAERILMEGAPVCTLARGVEYRPMNVKVEGWITYPTGKISFATVWMNK